MARIIVLAALLTTVALAFMPHPTAHACSCIRETAAEKYARVPVVFVGSISKLEYFYEPTSPGAAPIRWQWATFSITETWKGISDPSAIVRMGGTEGASCGFDLSKGTTYLVMATPASDGSLSSSFCHGTTEQYTQTLTTYGLARGTPVAATDNAGSIPTPLVPAPLATARAYGFSETVPSYGPGRAYPDPRAQPAPSAARNLWQEAREGQLGVLMLGLVILMLLATVIAWMAPSRSR